VRVLHVITDLRVGGAERMLAKLARRLPAMGVEMEVVSLGDHGVLGAEIEAAGVPVAALGMRKPLRLLSGVARLAAHIRRYDPAVVQTWLYHADLVGLLANRLAGGERPLAWNLRCSAIEPGSGKLATRIVRLALTRLSARPDLVIANSASGLAAHEAQGYRMRDSLVLPNGFDLDEFAPDPAAGMALRATLGLGPNHRLIGMVARLHPMKDHENFLRAAAIALARHPGLVFLLAGHRCEPDGPLAARASALGLGAAIRLLGQRDDVPAVLNALDVATLSSAHGEGFANVLGEAMACGTPCVATDVGDAAEVIAETGRIVPPRDPEALALAWLDLLARPSEVRRALGYAARRRMVERYEIGAIARRYADTYARLGGPGPTVQAGLPHALVQE
jgi:glycosyltransferase involved in cell wall biosynthesis